MLYHISSSLINTIYAERDKKRKRMDQIWEQQNPQTKNKVAKYYQCMKKATKFLVSFSLFSFFFSNPSWISLFLNSFILHLSNFPSQFLSLVHDKSYIFLLCNAILVFLAKYSTIMTNSSSQPQINLEDEFFEKNNENLQPTNALSSSEEFERIEEDENEEKSKCLIPSQGERIEEGKEEENDGMRGEKRETERKGEENGTLDDQEHIERENSEDGFSVEVQKEKEEDDDEDEDVNEDEEGGIAAMSTEELNRKFEEFIRKMKEDIRIEAQRQLIMV